MTVVREWFVDANLLVLLVVSATDRSLIAKHKRLNEFDDKAYDLLTELVAQANCVCVTPNTLTEASNLIGHHREPERSRCYDTLRPLLTVDLKLYLAALATADASAVNFRHCTDVPPA